MFKSIDPTVFIAVFAYMLLGSARWVAVVWLPGGIKARRFAVLTPLATVAFLGLAYAIAGPVPVWFVVFVALATVWEMANVTFCAKCGAIRMRPTLWHIGPECRRCNGKIYVPLWKAWNGPHQAAAT